MWKSALNISRNGLPKKWIFNSSFESRRSVSSTSVLSVKKIIEIQSGDTLNIKAEIVGSPRSHLLVKPEIEYEVDSKKACYMCSLNLNVKHTDVLILSQFVRNDGCMLPKRITGLCSRQQKKIGTLVQMAHKAGLMSNYTPSNSKKDPSRRKDWKKFNTYYDESTIFGRKLPNPFTSRFKTH